MDADSLFEEVRGECTAATWSRGVELVRAEAVHGESERGEEVALRVSTRGGMISPRVSLDLESLDWECECRSREAVCEHVAAAVIALRRARRDGAALPSPSDGGGRIGYRLSRHPEGLALERVVVSGGGESRLRSTLAALAGGRVDGPRFVATPADLEIERLLGSRTRGSVPRGLLPRLLALLEACPDVRLDEQPVRASGEPVTPVARLEDQGEGLLLRIDRSPNVTETLGGGVVLCGEVLRAVGESGLTGREIEELGRGRRFEAGEAAELVTEILPALERRLPVEIHTRRLPRPVRAQPRIGLQVEREGDALSVLATLVYGDPAIARVDAGKLVTFGRDVPTRDEAAERRLVRRLQSELELLPGRRLRATGAEAVALAERLRSFGGELRGDAHEAFFRTPPLVPRLRVDGDDFELSFDVEEGGGQRGPLRADPEQVLRAWREGESWVGLQGAGFSPLPADWLARHGDRLADLLAARDERGELGRCSMPDLARLAQDLGEPEPPSFQALRALADGSGALPRAELPAGLDATLRDYQRVGIDWLCALRDAGLGALLADDMGLR